MFSRILENPRELSDSEKQQLIEAQNKWFPVLIQSYNTTLFEMMASPIKKALVVGLVCLVVGALGMYVYFKMILNDKLSFTKYKFPIFILVGISVFIMISTWMKQTRLNSDIMLIITLTKPGATKYDYESSPVIRDKMMRNSFRRSGSSSNGIIGGALGYGLGSMGRRR